MEKVLPSWRVEENSDLEIQCYARFVTCISVKSFVYERIHHLRQPRTNFSLHNSKIVAFAPRSRASSTLYHSLWSRVLKTTPNLAIIRPKNLRRDRRFVLANFADTERRNCRSLNITDTRKCFRERGCRAPHTKQVCQRSNETPFPPPLCLLAERPGIRLFMNNSRCPFVHSFPRAGGMRFRNLEAGYRARLSRRRSSISFLRGVVWCGVAWHGLLIEIRSTYAAFSS